MTSLKKLDDLNDFLVELKYNQGSYFQYQDKIYKVLPTVQEYLEEHGLVGRDRLIDSENPIEDLLDWDLIEEVENFTEDMLIRDIHACRNEILTAVSMFELEDLVQVVHLIRTIMKTPVKHVNWDENMGI